MGTAFLSNCQAVNIFQFPSLFLIFQSDFSDQLRKIFLHLFPRGAFPLLVCESHPVIARREVPLNQSSYIPLSSPLILFGNLFRGGFLFLFSFLSPGSIPSGMLFLYLHGTPKVPYLPYVCPPHISTPVVSLIPLIELLRDVLSRKKVKNMAGSLLPELTFRRLSVILVVLQLSQVAKARLMYSRT